MRTLILAVGAAAIAFAGPSLAKPGKGGGHSAAHGPSHKSKASKTRVKTHPVTAADRNGNGILDSREGRMGDRHGVNDCPPGLAKKNNGCLPPGQAKRLFAQGQRVPTGYNYYTDYSRIPERYRDDIPEAYRTGAYRYIYRDDVIYVVDPTTRIVRGIFDLID